MTRFVLLAFALALGCSSNDDAPASDSGVNACEAASGYCQGNIRTSEAG